MLILRLILLLACLGSAAWYVDREQRAGRFQHVDAQGVPLYAHDFLDVGVFHKRVGTARDADGWFHIDRAGQALYAARFRSLEPFYNGLAFAETLDGRKLLVDAQGHCITV